MAHFWSSVAGLDFRSLELKDGLFPYPPPLPPSHGVVILSGGRQRNTSMKLSGQLQYALKGQGQRGQGRGQCQVQGQDRGQGHFVFMCASLARIVLVPVTQMTNES